MNYREIGLKVGLEIHFQLTTKHKLFCKCSPTLESEYVGEFIRRLRPTQSELHQVDPAALFEFQKGKYFKYLIPKTSTCLVEMDEEPPHPLNMEALKVCLRVAKALKSDLVDEVHVMRKIVIDGSNTTGFQRTCLIATGGSLSVDGKEIPIQTICLEEDACRLIEKSSAASTYSLDRLGIPLIEIATTPVIESPEEAVRVALEIGRLVKATGYVKSELGVIRQDVNISIEGGKVVEVKGIQRLSQLRKVIEFEARRQFSLLKIAEELKRRGVKEEDLKLEIKDVTHVFEGTKSRLIKNLLRGGKRVYAIKLKGFSRLIGMETAPNYRLGKEFAERVRFWTELRGLFHTDEMPACGISREEIEKLKSFLGADSKDAVVFIVASLSEAERALEKVIERAKEALYGPPHETRGSLENGVTYYLRPRPGKERMYPETDIPPIVVTEELIREIESEPLIPPRERISELIKLGLSEQLSWEIYDSKYYDLFLKLIGEVKTLKPSFIASILTETMKSIEREGYPVSEIGEDKIYELFKAVDEGLTAKESIVDVLKHLSKKPHESIAKIVDELGVRMMSLRELSEVIERVFDESIDLINELGEKSFKKLMGRVMRIVRGKADPKLVSKLISERLNRIISRKSQ